ncbi:MAG: hypothetical protein V7603_613 [Micromonosporaceae bacterium]
MLALTILGINVPDSRPLFIAALAVHVPAGIVSVLSGAVAASARKRPRRHPIAGRVYLVGIALVCASATVLAPMRWQHDWPLFLLDLLAFALAGTGLLVRLRQRPGWPARHGMAMAGSYVTLLTGFYVDNGPQLPLWDRLPHLTYWLLPVTAGVPLTVRALFHNRAWKGGARWPLASRSTSTTTRPLR